MAANIEIRGLDKLQDKLGDLEQVKTVLVPPMRRGVLRIQAQMQVYPPATWYRTGNLGRSWTTAIDRTGGRLWGVVGNNRVYAPWVQSARFQRAVFKRNGWTTDQTATEREMPAILDDFDGTVQRKMDE